MEDEIIEQRTSELEVNDLPMNYVEVIDFKVLGKIRARNRLV